MDLFDLNQLAVQAKTRYASSYRNYEVKLHQGFKMAFENFLQNKGNSIIFLNYSAEITIGASHNKIFLPNQWFCIATFLAEFVKELIKYKETLDHIRAEGNHGLTNKSFWDAVKSQKGRESNLIDEPLKSAIEDYFQDDTESMNFMKKFLTDYSWWNGSKTIDRADYYVSPVLNILGVVNVAQAYIAEIIYSYATDDDLMSEAIKLLEEIENDALIDEIMSGGKNLIVYGAPGTGKSRYVNDNYVNITRVVFHSEYTYYDFVGTYKPIPLYKESDSILKTIDGNEFELGEPLINYSFVPGPFISIILNALRQPTQMHTLLIEEINRANAAAVFGDMFQLLDRKSDGTSEYTITPSKELYNYLLSQRDIATYFENGLFLPPNLNIIATMNSADQGVFVLDSAFKRRWNFKYIPIIEDLFAHQDALVPYAGRNIKWKYMLKCINDKLKDNRVEEDRLIGQYFINTDEILNSSFLTSKLFIYLWDDVLRHKRTAFFAEGLRTYSELISAYYDGQDVLNILDLIREIQAIERNQDTEVSEDESEEE
ncbi:AAA family ATPase [Tissierella praeacuta]|uniref:AAA family ATPase n=1 Tax=Tissierella praeacuta TaxID=43131 RepID=UPI0033422E30